MDGFFKRGLVIDVTTQSSHTIAFDDALLSRTLGGKGLATQLLLDMIPAGTDPLSPENVLIFAVGPITGTSVWGSCRYGVFTKSPQTGCYCESYSGGTTAEYISATGYDAVIITGATERPIWIEINETGATFHPADNLWGKETYATEDHVKEAIQTLRGQTSGAVVIGPAGEALNRFAVIENDYWRSAGRTGVGAVLGSKHIKALAFHGSAKRPIADPAGLRAFTKSMAEIGKTDKGVAAYKKCGTSMLVDVMNEVGGFPTRYWQKGRCDHKDAINASALHSRCDVKPRACRKCYMACGRLATIKDGPHAGLTVEGPEYETIYAFGGLCEISSIEDIIYLNDLCDRLGMDTITAGNLVAFAMEAKLRGRIDYPISYGDTEAAAALLRDMAACQGIGLILSRGIRHAASVWGLEDVAVHVKGLEPPGYDPRALKGMGLAYASSDRGACHLRATFYKPELMGISDPRSSDDKAGEFKTWEDRLTYFDMLIVCRFYRDLYQWESLAAITRVTTGLDLTEAEMIARASAVTDDTRQFNLKHGITREDDTLPVFLTDHALPETGYSISRTEVENMVNDYYHVRGWTEAGEPQQASL